MSLQTLKSRALRGATAVLVAAGITAPAHATTALYSGGGTLAEKVYRDIMNCYGNHSGTDTETGLAMPPATCNGASPYNSNVELLYVGVGSGNGKKGFVNHASEKFTDGPKSPDTVPVPSTADFGPYFGTGTGATWSRNTTDTGPFFPTVSFVGSDDPLTSADISTYNTNSNGWGAPIQFPALAVAVAIPFNPATGTWNEHGKKPSGGGNSSLLNLSTNTLCGIFSGAITDWNDPAITADNGNQSITGGASKTITVVYRSDGSGTTFLTSNGLVNQCAATSHPIPAQWITDNGGVAAGNNNFFINVNSAGHLPANFLGANGSGGVKSTINSTPGSIGYVSPDFTKPVDSAGPKAANLQTWYSFTNSLTPVFKAPTSKNATQIVGKTKAPSFSKNSCPIGAGVGQASDGICAHNPLNWGVAVPLPLASAAYPLGGFTFIDTYTCYADPANVAALVGTSAGSLGYLRWYMGSATENSSKVKNSLASNGFAVLPGGWISAAKKLLTTDAVTKISTPGTAKTGCAAVSGSGA